jgi:hypothetical protein
MTDIVATIQNEKLSDGSEVHNVIIRDQSLARAIVVPAVTFIDAMALVEKITDAVNAHTVFKAEWR